MRRGRGFTLIEVLVALVLAGLVFAWAVPTLADSLARARQDTLRRAAIVLAESLVARLDADLAPDGVQTGMAGALRWQVSATPVAQAGGLRAIAVEVVVTPPRGAGFRLATLRLSQMAGTP